MNIEKILGRNFNQNVTISGQKLHRKNECFFVSGAEFTSAKRLTKNFRTKFFVSFIKIKKLCSLGKLILK